MKSVPLVPKSVRTLKALLLLTACLVLANCGKKKPKPAEPCGSGVNGASCSLKVQDHSTWSMVMQSYNQDPNTKRPVPGSERTIWVGYEFRPGTPQAQWRRTMIVESAAGNTSMFEEGVVKSVSANKIEFQPTLTSCSGTAILHVVPTDFELYYSRTGGTLKLDTKPIQTKVHNSLGEAVGSIFVDMIGQSLQSLLQSAFTFGSARSFLTSGSGTFILDAKPSAQRLGEKAAVVGCFSTIGSGFDKSAHPPTW